MRVNIIWWYLSGDDKKYVLLIFLNNTLKMVSKSANIDVLNNMRIGAAVMDGYDSIREKQAEIAEKRDFETRKILRESICEKMLLLSEEEVLEVLEYIDTNFL